MTDFECISTPLRDLVLRTGGTTFMRTMRNKCRIIQQRSVRLFCCRGPIAPSSWNKKERRTQEGLNAWKTAARGLSPAYLTALLCALHRCQSSNITRQILSIKKIKFLLQEYFAFSVSWYYFKKVYLTGNQIVNIAHFYLPFLV